MLDWKPEHSGLLADPGQDHYFTTGVIPIPGQVHRQDTMLNGTRTLPRNRGNETVRVVLRFEQHHSGHGQRS